MSQCKSCKAEIMWVTMERSGKKNPLDPVPVADGNIVIMSVSGIDRTARGIRADERQELIDKGALLYVSHFVSCPNSKLHKKNDPRPGYADSESGEQPAAPLRGAENRGTS